jgi:hypothetical protein
LDATFDTLVVTSVERMVTATSRPSSSTPGAAGSSPMTRGIARTAVATDTASSRSAVSMLQTVAARYMAPVSR